jgi:hypothetical protein
MPVRLGDLSDFAPQPSRGDSHLGSECEFRYEGGGEINLNVTDLGQIELSGNGRFLLTDMPSFIVKS